MKKFFSLVFLFVAIAGIYLLNNETALGYQECNGSPFIVPGTVIKLLPKGEEYGRPGHCIAPKKIVIHTTGGEPGQTLEGLYSKLADTSSNTEGVSTNFAVDETGNIMQFVNMYTSLSETTRGVRSYNDEQISIEIMSPTIRQGKSEISAAQYNAVIKLTRDLMLQYNIPLGDKDYTWKAPTDAYTSASEPGVFGHYQLNPQSKPDPGEGLMRDIKTDLAELTDLPTFNGTKTIHNLGYGASDAQRIESLIRSIYQERSPLSGHGADVIVFAREFNIDPLMIILMTNESQMCSDDGAVSPAGSDPDNYNCGGIIWDTTQRTLSQQEIDRWSARQGPWANDRYFTFVPSPKDGLGLFFNYLGISSKSLFKGKDVFQMYDLYNPCADSDEYGYACGAGHMQEMLILLEKHVGPPSTGNGAFVGNADGTGAGPGPGAGRGRVATACVYVKVGNPVGPLPVCDTSVITPPPGTSLPIPPVEDGNYKKAIKDTYSITVEAGLSLEFDKALWEFLATVSKTKFPSLVRGTVVHITPPCPGPNPCGTFQGPGKEISIRSNVETADLVKLLFAHEMGHVIWHHTPESAGHQTEHMNALTKEGGVTIYGDNPCYDPGNAYARQTEDYAEMIAYYLNPFLNEQTSCGTKGYNPFADGKFPQHLQVAKSILGDL